jgi:hypothetical protein
MSVLFDWMCRRIQHQTYSLQSLFMLGGQRASSIVEMHRNAEVKRLAPEQQMAARKRGHGTQEDTVKNPTEQRNLGALV